ncbi:MAG: hypothetical protein K9H26_07570 [Prolixibacteraceae bacterium]|nr:hypothetical protein [Prolixibacteraceae bacterium]
MKSYSLKRKKWYSSSFLVYSGEELVGELINKELSSTYFVNLHNRKFSASKENFWKEKKQFYEGSNPIGILNDLPFKNHSILEIDQIGKSKLSHNIWKGHYKLEVGGKNVAECKAGLKGITITAGNSVDDSLLAAMMVQTVSEENSEALIPVFLPLFIILFM